MNDAQLIQKVLETPTEDFSAEEIRLLRSRLAESEGLRAALNDRLRLDQHLVDALGASGETPDEFMAKLLKRQQQLASATKVRSLGIVLTLAACLAVAASLTWMWIPKPQPIDVADQAITNPEPQIDQPQKPPRNRSSVTSTTSPNEPPPRLPDSSDFATPSPQPEPMVPETDSLPAPWQQFEELEPVSYSQLLSLPENDERSSVSESRLKEWFTSASDHLHHQMSTLKQGDHTRTRLKGWFRLRGGFPKHAALRLQLDDTHKVRFHFYNGDDGVTVYHHRHDHAPWFAYAMRRGEDRIQPTDFRVVDSDAYRSTRSESRRYPAIHIYYDDANRDLVFHRGDVELIRVHRDAPPEEIYVEGEFFVRQLKWVKVNDFPAPFEDWPIQQIVDRPSDLDWQFHLSDGATLEQAGNGSVTIRSNDTDNHSWAWHKIPGYGPRMVELKLTGVDNVHAVFLADVHSDPDKTPRVNPFDGLEFSRNKRTDGIHARFAHCWDTGEADYKPLESPKSEVGSEVWVRLLHAAGNVWAWTSIDGKRWALHPGRMSNAKSDFNYFGFGAARSKGDFSVTVEQIRVRSLPRLTSLLSEDQWKSLAQISREDLRRSKKPLEDLNLSDDLQVIASTLRRIQAEDFYTDSLQDTTELILNQLDTIEAKQDALREMLLLSRSWPLQKHQRKYIHWTERRFADLHQAQNNSKNPPSFASLRRDLFHLPHFNRESDQVLSDELLNEVLLTDIQQNRWESILDACETMQRYYWQDQRSFDRNFRIVNWAGGVAIRHIDRASVSGKYLSRRDSGSVLVDDLSKEAFNISAELNAALASGAIQDACRLITQIPPTAAKGLAPSGDDMDHHYSVPAAIHLAAEQHPALPETMRSEYSDLAMIRVNSAIQQGNLQLAELVTLQFYQTPAAAKAHLWLGDLALARGDLAEATQHYLSARSAADQDLTDQLVTRLNILGYNAEESTSSNTISIGTQELSLADLVRSTKPLRESIRSNTSRTSTTPTNSQPFPQSVKLGERPLDIDWKWGHDVSRVPSDIRARNVDWRARQMAIQLDGKLAYVNNRFQVACIDLETSKRVWQQEQVEQNRGKAHDFPLQACQPLLVGDVVLTRMLHEKGFALYALNQKDGKRIWHSNLDGQLILATDPIAAAGRVLLVTLKEVGQSTLDVRLSRIDIETGQFVDHRSLFRIRESWFDRGIGTLHLVDDRLIIDLGGALAACNVGGQLQWVRKQLTYPSNIDSSWVRQAPSQLVALGERGISYHAGMLFMDCYNLDNGKKIWSIPAIDILGIAPWDEETVLVRYRHQFALVSAKNGERLEVFPAASTIQSSLVSNRQIIGISDSYWPTQLEKDRKQLFQMDFDAMSGTSIPLEDSKISTLGPLFFGHGRWWIWYHQSEDSSRRILAPVAAP